jgi:hypothetical protein
MRSAILVTLAALATLASAGPASALPGGTTDPSITNGTQGRALAAARARFAATHTRTYSFRAALSCFCPENYRTARAFRVRAGRPVAAPPQHLRDVATVGRMFARIQRAIDAKVSGLTVSYAANGVPTRIAIDESDMIADEESYYTIDRFKRLG